MSWLRFWWAFTRAKTRFLAQYYWLVLTGRKHKDAPQSFEDAYNRQTRIWNAEQNRRHG